jgi:DNA primase small subunit
VPSDVYYSSAYYERPSAKMNSKGWLGADLVFDIDADHIQTPCATVHDIWVCNGCDASGTGMHPLKCSVCSGTKFKEKPWLCDICLECSKVEVIKLIDVLTDDFGFSSKDLTVAFSGHRGYHVHVESESVRELDSLARKEIVDYLMGIGLDAKFHGISKSVISTRRVSGPELNDKSWQGRVAKGTYEFLHITSLLTYKEEILESWNKKGPWGAIKNISPETWRKIAQYGVEKQSVKIDTVVTPDVNRLIRLPNSLHGKTGLKKVVWQRWCNNLYNELYELWRKEKETLDIQRISKNFYPQIAFYIKKSKEEKRMLDKKTTKAKLLDCESKNVKFMVGDLFALRHKKLQETGLSRRRIARDALTKEEEKLYVDVFSLTEEYHDFSRNILRGQLSNIEKGAKSVVNVLRFVQEIPALIGSDLKTYGPFCPEDIATLPIENARVLIEQGVAVKVDSKNYSE